MKTKILRNIFLSLSVIFALATALPVQLTARGEPPNGPQYRNYTLIDLGTLGGPDSSQVFPAQSLNNRGEVIAFSATAVPDPYAPNCLQSDCFVNHGIVRENNGVIIDLPFPAGVDGTMNNSLATWITENGLIAGMVENGLIDPLTGFPQVRAVFWDRNHSATDLGTLGGNSSQANAVNNRGEVVGMALNATPENPAFSQFMNFLPAATQTRAFLWQNGSMQDLGTLGGNDACAVDINGGGQIFGFSYTNSTPNVTTGIPTVHPFLATNGQMQDLGSLGGTIATPGGSFGPFGPTLNESGQAIGTSTLSGDSTNHAFLWSGGIMNDLGTLGGANSVALAIDQSGDVVGVSDISASSPFHHAFLWQNGQMINLGVVTPCHYSTATGINSGGQIVGDLGGCTSNPNDITYESSFIWEHGGPMVDLNTLVTPPSDVHITGAAFINERGEIAGVGLLPNGDSRAVLLVPLPGP